MSRQKFPARLDFLERVAVAAVINIGTLARARFAYLTHPSTTEITHGAPPS